MSDLTNANFTRSENLAGQTPPHHDMVWIPGGTFMMGSDKHYSGRSAGARSHRRWFLDGHTCGDERGVSPICRSDQVRDVRRAPAKCRRLSRRKARVARARFSGISETANNGSICAIATNGGLTFPGANWRHPEGPASSLKGRAKHPVVQLAYEDAEAYAKWVGKELPTEAEWEFAARGGLDGAEFVWGNELTPGGKYMANTWQGEFPWQNLKTDGFEGTAPVGSFPPNGYGLYDMAGNVWEWTTDWYQEHGKITHSCCASHQSARRQSESRATIRNTPDVKIPRKVMKGGSYLCAPNYCRRYRPAARMAQPIDTSTCHLGFRCIVRGEGQVSRVE